MKWRTVAILALALNASPIFAASNALHKNSFDASVVRGEIVFRNYCTLCHGDTAEGNGRAARLYTPRPANLRKSIVPDLYKETIIRIGGAAYGRSAAMPSWQDELTEEQIHDVVNYLRTIAPADAAK